MKTAVPATRPARRLALVLIVLSSVWACTEKTPGPGPSPLPSGPVRSLVSQGSFTGLRNIFSTGEVYAVNFATSSTGTLEISVDWTSFGSDLDFDVYRGPCTVNQAVAGQCQSIASAEGVTKPERLTITNLGAGSYVVFIANVNAASESGTYQIFLTS
jgi:hypothetical protein